MKNRKLIILSLALVIALAFVAGCGSSDNKVQQPQQSQKQTEMSGHSMTMPKGDPMPMMKEMDKNLQDMMRQVKAGQTMDAQKSASQIAGLADKVLPHMMDAGLKDSLQKAAYDLRETMNNGKVDQTVIEGKLKTMQDVMTQATKDLESMAHSH
jgi:hypothetical protein